MENAPVPVRAPPTSVFPEHPANIKAKKTRKHNPIVQTNPFALMVLIINLPPRFSGNLKVSATFSTTGFVTVFTTGSVTVSATASDMI